MSEEMKLTFAEARDDACNFMRGMLKKDAVQEGPEITAGREEAVLSVIKTLQECASLDDLDSACVMAAFDMVLPSAAVSLQTPLTRKAFFTALGYAKLHTEGLLEDDPRYAANRDQILARRGDNSSGAPTL